MPIVLHTHSTKNANCTEPTHDSNFTRSSASKRTLSSDSFNRLIKKELGTHLQHQRKDHDLIQDRPSISCSADNHNDSRGDALSPSQLSIPLSSELQSSSPLELQPAHQSDGDSLHSPYHHYPSTSEPNIGANIASLVTPRLREHSRPQDEERDEQQCEPNSYLWERSERDHGTPSPSLSPLPCSPSPKSVPSFFDLEYDPQPFLMPLSPPASATMTCPPPSILSKSPSWDSETIDTSDTTAEKKASFSNTVYSPSPLSPSSFWLGEKRGYEDEPDSPRTVMRRSIGSPRQSSLPLEDDEDDQTKEASSVCTPLSLAVVEMPSPSELVTEEAGIGVSGSETGPGEAHFVISDLSSMDENRKSSKQSESWPETRQENLDELSARARASARASASASQNVTEKPEVSYTDMISQAILGSSELKLTLADIYAWIMQNYPYYRHSNSGWQNSIRNKLSLNKAFLKMERGPGDPGKGCFWALQLDVLESSDSAPCKKKKDVNLDAASQCSLSSSVYGSRTKSLSPPAAESMPSPAASEDAEDAKGLRRSGRARRPPRSKEAEDYVAQHGRQLSMSSTSLSTPPTSPSPHGQDRTCALSAASTRKRMSVGAAATTKEHGPTPHETTYDERDVGAEHKSPSSVAHPRRSIQEIELASIPGVVTSQRVRRPPQNLAEFVSSEDFKTTPCATKHDRASSSSVHHQSGASKVSGPVRSASVPDLTIVTNPAKLNSRPQPVTVPLSALSYTKRRSQSYSCLNSRKERHGAGARNYANNDSDSEGWGFRTQKEMVKRPRRDCDRELKEDREGDSSDSDFEFLRDEKENYRRLGHRIRRMQRTRCWRTHEYKDRDRHLKEYHLAKEKIRLAKDEGRKLLRDPTVINYGFDIEDGTYILDSHQGALFNSVTWPEFSDVKDDTT